MVYELRRRRTTNKHKWKCSLNTKSPTQRFGQFVLVIHLTSILYIQCAKCVVEKDPTISYYYYYYYAVRLYQIPRLKEYFKYTFWNTILFWRYFLFPIVNCIWYTFRYIYVKYNLYLNFFFLIWNTSLKVLPI